MNLCKINLYVNPAITSHVTIIKSFQKLLKQKIYVHCVFHVIDVIKESEKAFTNQVSIIPTIIRTTPGREKRLIGDFSDPQNILDKLVLPEIPKQ